MIPNLLTKFPVPRQIPDVLERKIAELSKGVTREEFLRKTFDWIVSRWSGGRFNLFAKFGRFFQIDLETMMETKGYLHCTQMNYLLRVMAVKSRLFHDEDIQQVLTHSWYIAPHQYLRVRLENGKMLDLDPWNWQFGIDYGKHGAGFASTAISPVR